MDYDIVTDIKQAAKWLKEASSCFPGDGVAQYYSVTAKWQSPSLNLAGEIIPLFYSVSEFLNDKSYAEKADELALLIMDKKFRQVENIYTIPVFQAGQIILGLMNFYKYSAYEKAFFLAVKLAQWLCSIQDPDGTWKYVFEHEKERRFFAYDSKSAYILLELWRMTGITRFYNCADKNLSFVLSRQLATGWYQDNSQSPGSDAELRYIAYVMDSILRSGILLKDNRYINSAKICADTVLKMQKIKGDLSMKYNKQFNQISTKTCCAGSAQTAIVWFNLYDVYKDNKYFEGALKVNNFLRQIQKENCWKTKGAVLSERGSRVYSAYATLYFVQSLMHQYKTCMKKGKKSI